MKRVKASHHLSPLRYPGGKGKLASAIKHLVTVNNLLDCTYVEPFAGGAGVALSLLCHGYVERIIINDLSLPIYAFWKAALDEPEEFVQRIANVQLTVAEWALQKECFKTAHSPTFELGFAAFYLNRTNHSGVLNGGIIGGVEQSSSYGIEARFNRLELAARIQRLARFRDEIEILNMDAGELIGTLPERCNPTNTLMYADPPYVQKGPDLYYSHYKLEDHKRLRDVICAASRELKWCVSYDNHPLICELYQDYRSQVYDLSYSVRNGKSGREIMFFSDNLLIENPALDALKSSSNCAPDADLAA